MTSPQVHVILNGRWKENCYVISDSDREALLIDPGDEPERIADFLDSQHLAPLAILVTHGHHDHTDALPALTRRYSVPWYIHSREQYTLRHRNLLRKMFDAAEPIDLPLPDGFLDQMGSPLSIGSFDLEVIDTPGHTRGGVSFVIGDCLFSGDTLFRKSIGRVDLPGGDRRVLGNSLRALSLLAPDLTVFPGHGDSDKLAKILNDNCELWTILDENQAT